MTKIADTVKLPVFMAGELLPERQRCKAFGCGKKLTLSEELCGKYCTGCTGSKKVDIMRVLKMP